MDGRQDREGSGEGVGGWESDRRDRAVYIISVAAELAGVHPQTLRIYERKGLLNPARTSGNTRRYSDRDIARLQSIQRLTQDHGINLAGVEMILEMEGELEKMRSRIREMSRELERSRKRLREELDRMADRGGAIVPRSSLRGLPWSGTRSREDTAGEGGPQRRGPIPVGPAGGGKP